MRESIGEGREATKLLEYSEDFDEPTGRHEINVNVQHPPQPSSPQIDVQQKPGVLTVVFTVVQKFPAWGAVLVALAAIAAYTYLRVVGAVK